MNSSIAQPWQWLSDLFRAEVRNTTHRQIGVEVERIALWKDGSPFTYTTNSQTKKPGARELLLQLHQAYGWKCVESVPGQPIGLELPNGKVSLEPGSQLEFAISPQKNLNQVDEQLATFESQVEKVTRDWQGFHFLGLAVNPLHKLNELDVIPAPRYHIMTEVLGKTGSLGTSMMRRTSSVQINLDYTSEEEAIEMLKVSLAVAPLSTALFANSPFLERKTTGFLSTRAEIWRNTDPARTGLLKEAFEPGFNFDSYSAYLWKLPLMFVQNNEEKYISAEGRSLADIAAGKLPHVSVRPATMRTAIQQLFTEARLKPGYVEVRSVDGQLPPYRMAAAAFWLGLLYDSQSRKRSLELLGILNAEERRELWVAASRVGLKATVNQYTLHEVAAELVGLSKNSLIQRGFSEEKYLLPLIENIKKGNCPAQNILNRFKTEWHEDISAMIQGEI